jgi:predicted glutamine amidotransferase
MCGIVYGKRTDGKAIARSLIKRYQGQKARGTEGFGYIAVYDGKVASVKRFEDEKEALTSLEKENADEILFHHRFPTSTPNFKELNHPIAIKSRQFKSHYYVVHNGVISNDDELYTKHYEMGIKYTTLLEETTISQTRGRKEETKTYQFNDSECLAVELALYFEGKQDNIDIQGSVSFICYQTDKDGNIQNLYYGKNYGNPLVLETCGNSLLFLKSEGNGSKVDSHEITKIDYNTGKTETIDVSIGTGVYGICSTSYGNYGCNTYGYNTKTVIPERRGLYDDDYDDEQSETKNRNTYNYDSSNYDKQFLEQEASRLLTEIEKLHDDLSFVEVEIINLDTEMKVARAEKDSTKLTELTFEMTEKRKERDEIESKLLEKEYELDDFDYENYAS